MVYILNTTLNGNLLFINVFGGVFWAKFCSDSGLLILPCYAIVCVNSGCLVYCTACISSSWSLLSISRLLVAAYFNSLDRH